MNNIINFLKRHEAGVTASIVGAVIFLIEFAINRFSGPWHLWAWPLYFVIIFAAFLVAVIIACAGFIRTFGTHGRPWRNRK